MADNEYTGKPVPETASRLGAPNGQMCDTCGGEVKDYRHGGCPICGAPQCCPACCLAAENEHMGYDPSEHARP